MANHGELVGQFSNGRTVVANNKQIIAGIEGGVERAGARVLQAKQQKSRTDWLTTYNVAQM